MMPAELERCNLRGDGDCSSSPWRRAKKPDSMHRRQVVIQGEGTNFSYMGVVASVPHYLRNEPVPYYWINEYERGGHLSGIGNFHPVDTLIEIEDAS